MLVFFKSAGLFDLLDLLHKRLRFLIISLFGNLMDVFQLYHLNVTTDVLLIQ